MEAVDVFVDLAGLTRVAAELHASVGQFADIARPADIRSDAGEVGGPEVSDAVAEFGLRWQHRCDSLGQDLRDAAAQAALAVRTYEATEDDLASRCTDGVAPSPSPGARHEADGHAGGGSW